MSEKIKEMEELEEEAEFEDEDEFVDDDCTESKMTKVKAGLKKYGKKIAIALGFVAVGIAGFALGRKGSNEDTNEDLLELDYTPTDNCVDDDSEESET